MNAAPCLLHDGFTAAARATPTRSTTACAMRGGACRASGVRCRACPERAARRRRLDGLDRLSRLAARAGPA